MLKYIILLQFDFISTLYIRVKEGIYDTDFKLVILFMCEFIILFMDSISGK